VTREIFREDAYARTCTATVTAVNGNQVELDQTVFYPLGGGQPGDTGRLTLAGGGSPRVTLEVTDTRKGDSPGSIVHICKDPVPPGLSGSQVEAEIHWERRYRLMRMHTCLHLLCAVVPAAVTGGAVRDGSGRLDFDWPESTLDKAHVSAELPSGPGQGSVAGHSGGGLAALRRHPRKRHRGGRPGHRDQNRKKGQA